MKRALKTLLTLALLAVATVARAQVYAPNLDYVERYTDKGDGTYLKETGNLKSDGTFIAVFSPLTYRFTDGTSSSTAYRGDVSTTEIKPINAKYVYTLSLWDSLESIIPGYFSHNFARSTQTYPISGVPYIIVNVAGGSTSSAGGTGGSTGGGSTGGSSGGGTTTTNTGSGPRFVNLSFRAVVPANGNIIPGFVVADTPNHDKLTVLIRVVGPTLASFGVGGTLADPKITVYDSKNTVVGSNDNWGDSDKTNLAATATKVGAFPLQDGSKDAAMVATLAPGSYTATINAPKDAAGEVLVEVYAVEK